MPVTWYQESRWSLLLIIYDEVSSYRSAHEGVERFWKGWKRNEGYIDFTLEYNSSLTMPVGKTQCFAYYYTHICMYVWIYTYICNNMCVFVFVFIVNKATGPFHCYRLIQNRLRLWFWRASKTVTISWLIKFRF